MSNTPLRILFLSHALPTGVSNRFPNINNAPHAQQSHMVPALGRISNISSIGLLPAEIWNQIEPKDDSVGLEHKLLLWNLKPELWHRWRSWRKLRKFYLNHVATDGMPDVLLVTNIEPVFHYFVRWLKKQPHKPLITLFLNDCGDLGQKISWFRRFRYQFKPMQMLANKAFPMYDACIALSIGTKRYFETHHRPWLWMPGAYNFGYESPHEALASSNEIRFVYFGGLSESAATLQMVKVFLESGVPGSLHICGFGEKTAEILVKISKKHHNIFFDGLLPLTADCMRWAEKVDVLINPRLPNWENSFPSKIFQYGITGKAILSTKVGGVDEVLGIHGLYFDADNFEIDLSKKLLEISKMDRRELQLRGTLIRKRILAEFNWDNQASRIVAFLNSSIITSVASRGERSSNHAPQ